MTIGERIKQLRKENDVTQEKLADYLSISYQAISKWENNTACPDISLLVPLANFFGVTTDVILGRDEEQQENEMKEFQKEGARLANLGFVKEQIPLWRSAVLKYPKNFECLTMLAFSLFETSHSGVFDEDEINKCIAEAIEICERIMEDCTENCHRSSAIQMLTMIYGDEHRPFYDEEKAVKYALEASNIFCCSDILLVSAYGYTSEKAMEQKHRNTIKFIDFLNNNIVHSFYKNIDALNTMLGIWNAIFYDGNFLFYHCRIAEIYRFLAIKYAELNDKEKAIESLYQAKKHALSYMNIPDGEQHYTSIFVCKATHTNSNTSKNFEGSELDLIRQTLENKAFDFMRDTTVFKAFVCQLTENQ